MGDRRKKDDRNGEEGGPNEEARPVEVKNLPTNWNVSLYLREANDKEKVVWITDTWSRSFTDRKEIIKKGSGSFVQLGPDRFISARLFFKMFRSMVTELLSEATAVVLAEKNTDEPMAWAVYDTQSLYYVYVVKEARKLGIGKHLVDTIDEQLPGLYVNFLTRDGVKLWPI